MYFDTSANKMKVYNGTTNAWDDVASVGSFYVNTISSSSGTGGGSATFNGSAYRFTLSNAGTSAQQHIVSVNGVIQSLILEHHNPLRDLHFLATISFLLPPLLVVLIPLLSRVDRQ